MKEVRIVVNFHGVDYEGNKEGSGVLEMFSPCTEQCYYTGICKTSLSYVSRISVLCCTSRKDF